MNGVGGACGKGIEDAAANQRWGDPQRGPGLLYHVLLKWLILKRINQ